MSSPRWAKTRSFAFRIKDTGPDRVQAAIQRGLHGANVDDFVLQKICTSIYHLHPFTLTNDPKMSIISHIDTKLRAIEFFKLVRIIV